MQGWPILSMESLKYVAYKEKNGTLIAETKTKKIQTICIADHQTDFY